MNKPNYTQPGTSDRQSEIDVRNYRNLERWRAYRLFYFPRDDFRTDADRERYEKMMARRCYLLHNRLYVDEQRATKFGSFFMRGTAFAGEQHVVWHTDPLGNVQGCFGIGDAPGTARVIQHE